MRKGVLCLCVLGALSAMAGTLQDNLRLYLPFDGSVEPLVAKGSKQVIGKTPGYVAGKAGQAADLNSKIKYYYSGNIKAAAGTLSYWFAPSWNGDDKSVGRRTFFGAVHLKHSYLAKPQRLFYMTGKTLPQKGFKWDYGCYSDLPRKWKSGQWHHLVSTWNGVTGEKRFYIDGKLQKKNHTNLMFKDAGSKGTINIGDGAPGYYDELAVWDRILSDAEIAKLYDNPVDCANKMGHSARQNAEKTRQRLTKIQLPLDSLTYYQPFDGNLSSAKSKGASLSRPAGKISYSAGVVNQGAVLHGSKIDFSPEKNFDITRGSLGIWVKFGDVFSKLKSGANIFRSGHFTLSVRPEQGKLFFMTGMHNGEYFRWDYSCESSSVRKWKVGEWHHIGIVWDRELRCKELYLDGKLEKRVSSERMADAVSPAEEMYVGGGLNAEVDELVCFSKPLAKWQMAMLCGMPAQLAKELKRKTTHVVDNLKFQVTARKKLVATLKASPVEFTLKPVAIEQTIVNPGEKFIAEIPVRNPSVKAYSGSVEFVLRDFWMKDCGRKSIELKLEPGESKILKPEFTPQLSGIYKVEVVYDVNGKKNVRDLSSFACYPGPPKRDPDSFFGNHINAWGNGKFLAQAARLGQTWQRNHNMVQTTWWDKVQPDKGKFTWTYDFQLNDLKKYNMPLLGQLFTTPYWAAAIPQSPKHKGGYNKCWTPNLKYFEKYVYETVSRYKDYIKYWEIWNEPAVGIFWKGNTEEFGKMVQVAVKAAKKADPDCQVMSAGYTCPAWAWHEAAAKAGAFKGLDIISFHYGCYMIPPEESYAKLAAIVEHFQKLAVKYGPGKKLPMWSTEAGCGDTTFLRGLDYPQLPPVSERKPLAWHEGAIRTVQGEAVLMSHRVLKHFIYLQNRVAPSSPKVYQNNSMLDVNQSPRPKLMARVIMQDQLDWTKFYARVFRKEGRFWANVYQRKNAPGTVVLMWCGDGGELKLNCKWPGKVSRIVNIMGHDLKSVPSPLIVTREPFYVHVAASAAEVAKSLEQAKIKVTKEPVKLALNDGPDKPDVPVLPDFVAPSESPSGNFTVDISKQCNMGLADDKAGDGKGGWSDEGPFNDLRDLKPGKHTYFGVTFNIIDPSANHGKAVITLKGKSVTPTMPKKVTIPVNRNLRCLYFLQAASWGSPGDICEYILNFEDGTTQKFTVNIPLHSNNWWNGYNPKEVSKPVAIRVTNTNTGKPQWRYLRVFELAKDPLKKSKVKSVDIISIGARQTPIILAVSATGF